MGDSEISYVSEWPPQVEAAAEDLDSEDNDEPRPKVAKKQTRKCDVSSASQCFTRWLRQKLPTLKQKYNWSEITNPKSLLNLAAQTEEGTEFLEKELQILSTQEDVFKDDPVFLFTLGTYCDKLHKIHEGLKHLEASLKLEDIDYELVMNGTVSDYFEQTENLAEYQRDLIHLYSKLKMEEKRTTQVCPDVDRKVLELDYSKVSSEQFKQFCQSKTSAVFINVPSPTRHEWSLEYIKSKVGDTKFTVKSPKEGSTEWAGLETVGEERVGQFIDNMEDGKYLFDWSLPLHAPALNSDFSVPALVSDNYLTRTSNDCIYHNAWPSLFIAKAWTNSGLHIDAFASHFWMYLISGEKKWTFYPPDAEGQLQPMFYDSMDPVFQAKNVDNIPSYCVHLKPGQLLFVPGGSPHKVENVEDSVAVSGNFVNETNIDEAVQHFKINALTDPRTRDLLHELIDLGLAK